MIKMLGCYQFKTHLNNYQRKNSNSSFSSMSSSSIKIRRKIFEKNEVKIQE